MLVGEAWNLTRSILPGLGNKVAIMVISEDAMVSDCWEWVWDTILIPVVRLANLDLWKDYISCIYKVFRAAVHQATSSPR
jgi:hypothetical protein